MPGAKSRASRPVISQATMPYNTNAPFSSLHRALTHRRLSQAAHINHLPPEVMRMILLHPDLHDSTYSRKYIQDSVDGLISLGSVCRYWRNIIYRDRLAWTKVRISRCGKISRSLPQKLRFWLEQSKGEMLHIDLIVDESAVAKRSARVNEILDVLLEHKHRWRSIDLFLTTHDVYGPLVNITPGALPNLVSMVAWLPAWPPKSLQQLWNNVCHKKNARFTTPAWGVYDAPPSLPVHAPWHQIKEIYISDIATGPELLSALSQCFSLQKLIIFRLRKSGEEDQSELSQPLRKRTVTLPNLQILDICPADYKGECDDVLKVINSIQLPALTHCTIHWTALKYADSDVSASLWDALYRLLLESGCRLQRLEFVGYRESLDSKTGAHICAFLQSTFSRNIQILSMQPASKQLFEELERSTPASEKHEESSACPQIHTLDVDADITREAEDSLLRMLSARCARERRTTPLKLTLSSEFTSFASHEAKAALNTLVQSRSLEVEYQ